MMEKKRRVCLPGVIFDLDGTLVDTLDDIVDSINTVFGRANLGAVSRETIRGLLGRGITILLEDILRTTNAADVTALAEDFGRVYRERMLGRSRLYPGVADLLDRLAELRVPMAVLSNKPDEFTVPMCKALLGRWTFVKWQGARSEHLRKPDPRCACELAHAMGRNVSDVRFVGDSTIDIRTAHNAGMRSVAVTWGYRNRDELESGGPAWIIDTPAELLDLLDGNA